VEDCRQLTGWLKRRLLALAHLNRDFRELAGTTPTAFVRSRLASGGVAA
jgi:hypothetical protein